MLLSASREARVQELQERERIDHTRAVRERFAAQVPKEYQRQEISRDALRDGAWSASLDRSAIVAFSRYLNDPDLFLIMTGSTGNGKSTAAFAVADRLIERYSAAASFVSASAMLATFSFGASPTRTAAVVLAEYSAVPILVIDDLGSMNDGMTDHQRRSLWSLIDARWSNGLYTIITTNMAINEFGMSELVGESAWDRIRDSVTVIEFSGESFRGRKQ